MASKVEISFLKAYDDYSQAIFRYCYFRVFDREQARDLVQETFMKTWEYLASGKEVQNLRAFLYKVANNMVIDLSRKKKSLSIEDLAEKGFDPLVEERPKIQQRLDIGATATSTSPVVCIQVITPARDPQTRETREFPTPCDVPEGWEVIPNPGIQGQIKGRQKLQLEVGL